MKRVLFSILVAALAGFTIPVTPLRAQDKGDGKTSLVPQTPEWQALKTLVGQWESTSEQGGKSVTTTLEVRMTGDQSAILHLMAKDAPYEMVTMFHPDGKRLLATHALLFGRA